MLQLRPNCECCDKDLPPGSREAMICSFECTFCTQCASDVLDGHCPNCCRRTRPPPGAPCGQTWQVSGVHRTRFEAGRLRADQGSLNRRDRS